MGIESISMFRCGFSFLFCFVGILCICLSCAGSFHTIKCAETERQALLKFKDALILCDEDALSSWNTTSEDCCKWEGISCDNLTGHVTSLDLEDYAERGKLDSSICELQHLTSLDLTYNGLEGKIPKCIGSLSQLIELKLGDNELVGDIPPTLGNLSNLQILDLGENGHLVSNDLEWLSHLSNLRYLYMTNVNLSLAVDWLSSINKIPTLMELHLRYCGLHQADPQFILHSNSSTSLKVLDLADNNLNSLSWVINVSKVLTYLDLSNNSLQHSIPYALGNMTSLQYLGLSYNELEGSIPKSFRNLYQLTWLLLDTNKLSGQLSDSIRHLSCAQNGLQYLVLKHNPFSSAPLPDFSSFSSLMVLNLRNTNIVGPLPQSIGHLPSLTTLDLSFNQLSGSQSLHEVAKLTSLEELSLAFNQLNGPLPYTIGQLSNLTDLWLTSNKLNGVISEAHLSNLSGLRRLGLAHNLLSFNLSSNWVPPFQLSVLYASSCILGPKFPKWLKHQKQLQMLQISNSSISDSLPE